MFSYSRLIMVAACLLVPHLVRAQETRQDPRVANAKTACAAGDVQQAVRLLAELYTATNDPIWIFNQGRCYHQNNQLQNAHARFKEFLRKSGNGPAEDVTDAQNYIREIEADLRKSEPKPEGPAVGTSATVTKTPAEGAPDANRGRGLRYAGIGCGVLGGAALVSGVIFSVLVNKANQDIQNQKKSDSVPVSTLTTDLTNGPRYETLQWVSYGVSAAALLTGTVLYYIGASEASTSTATPAVTPLVLRGGVGANVRLSF
jgi:hypothetical protein